MIITGIITNVLLFILVLLVAYAINCLFDIIRDVRRIKRNLNYLDPDYIAPEKEDDFFAY